MSKNTYVDFLTLGIMIEVEDYLVFYLIIKGNLKI